MNSSDLCAPHIIDIVDLPTPRELKRWASQSTRASGVTTVTEGIRREVLRYGIDAKVIGNGADVQALRSADGGGPRARYGIEGKLVIGHIGNHAEWSGLDFLLDVFKEVKQRINNACLLIVGPGIDIPRVEAKVKREGIKDVIFTGAVPVSVVPRYFKAIDIGALPYEVDPHAMLSFPIFAVAMGAARRIVIASPLEMLKGAGFGYITVLERNVRLWADAIVDLKDAQWDRNWDAIVDAFDWRNISKQMVDFITSRVR